jgi:hypothetical protein
VQVQPVPDEERITIASAAHAETGKGVCILRWGPVHTALDPEVVLHTARDLQAAAARAETDVALITVLRDRINADESTTAAFLVDVRTHRPMLPGTPALRIEAVAGYRTGRPQVHVARGSMKGALTPDEARTMALHWTETALASQIDARLRYVLGEFPQLDVDAVDAIFAGIRNTGGDDTIRRTR